MQAQKDRLMILRENNVITASVYEAMEALLDFLKAQGIKGGEDRLDMMSTHIAMALMRAQRGESITAVDGDLAEEIRRHPAYSGALALWNAQSDILGVLPEGEKYYVLANFCNILKE